jgi:hypothetical protein
MCLILTGPAKQVRSTLLETAGLIEDIYSGNSDGVGFMYATKKGLKVVKRLPRSAAEVATMVRSMPTDDRNLAIHFRFTTHGDTNLDNCHPYDVVPGFIALMHNGVLHTGNAADKSRSDTYHFIKEFLTEPMHGAPDLAFSDSFLKLVGSYIRDNRFVFMDGEGRISHVNKGTGISHGDLWFSNTYAWTPSLLIPEYRSKYSYASGGSYKGRYLDEDDNVYGSYGNAYYSGSTSASKSDKGRPPVVYENDVENEAVVWDNAPSRIANMSNIPTKADMIDVLCDCNVAELERHLDSYPFTTLDLLVMEFDAVPTKYVQSDSNYMSEREEAVKRALIARDSASLLSYIRTSDAARSTVAEVACYYLDWDERASRAHVPYPAPTVALIK